LQPLADGLKSSSKKTSHRAARTASFTTCAVPHAVAVADGHCTDPVRPGEFKLFGQRTSLGIANLNIGLLFLFAITSLGCTAWRWPDGHRTASIPAGRPAQLGANVSYELALTMSW